MTLAERLQNEKYNATNFDAVAFLEKVEEYFTARSYNTYLRIDTGYLGNGEKERGFYCGGYFNNRHQESSLCVAPERLNDAINLLKENGFHLYHTNHWNMYAATIADLPCVEIGIHTLYPIR